MRQRKESVCTHIVQVDVDAAEVVQHEVSNRVGALDGVRVAVEGFKEPRVSAGIVSTRSESKSSARLTQRQ